MAHIVYCWELGANLGHLGAFLPLSRALTDRGHRLSMVVHHPDTARAMFGDEVDEVVGTPPWRPLPVPRVQTCYADTLYACGYHDRAGLGPRLAAWRDTLNALRPELLILDASPTALAVSWRAPIPRIIHDTPYGRPPATVPLPPLGRETPRLRERAAAMERQVLRNLRHGCRDANLHAPRHLADLFDVEETFLRSLPALDPYPQRQEDVIWTGPAFTDDTGAPADWPPGDGPRIFAYLRPTSPWFASAHATLAAAAARVILASPGLTAQDAERLRRPHLQVYPGPVQLRALRRSADLAVCHGGDGTTGAFLLGGVPVAVVPNHHEQQLSGARLHATGLGAMADGEPEQADLNAMIARAMHPEVRARVAAFADRHADPTPADRARPLVDRVEHWLSQPRAHRPSR